MAVKDTITHALVFIVFSGCATLESPFEGTEAWSFHIGYLETVFGVAKIFFYAA